MSLDDASTLTMIEQAAAGDLAAWRKLQERVLPQLERWAASNRELRKRQLHRSPDDVRAVVVSTLERLRDRDYANLHRYLAYRAEAPDAPFERWLYRAFEFATREHLRERYGRRSDTSEDAASTPIKSKRDVNTHAGRLADTGAQLAPASRTGVTMKITLREVMAYIDAHFEPAEARAMHLYIESDCSLEEIALELGLESTQVADRLVRKLKERLRVQFKDPA